MSHTWIVNLCLKVPLRFRKSCFQIWHSAKQLLTRRIFTCNASKRRQGTNGSGYGPASQKRVSSGALISRKKGGSGNVDHESEQSVKNSSPINKNGSSTRAAR